MITFERLITIFTAATFASAVLLVVIYFLIKKGD